MLFHHDSIMLYFYVAGLVQGYSNEKSESEQQVQVLEEKQEALIRELEAARLRLGDLESAHTDLAAREEDLRKQREAIEQSVGDEEQGGWGLLPCLMWSICVMT